MNTKKVIINASAAKTGGAETIIKTFIESIPDSSNTNFTILAPIDLDIDKTNVSVVYKSTSGIQTLFFSSIGILYYIFKYKTSRIISFNNINCLFFTKHGITYFHQYKLLDSSHKELKIRIYEFLIRFFLRKNQFIVQSNFIKNLFSSKFPKLSKPVISCWPGFQIPEIKSKKNNESNEKKTGILPIAYNAPHKNVELLLELKPFFKENDIQIITLLPNKLTTFNDQSVFNNIGTIDRKKLFEKYNEVDFLIFTSTSETVGLPVFEFLHTGKPVFVYAADYAKEFFIQFNKPENLILFENAKDFESKYGKAIKIKADFYDYSKGEWNKIFKLL